PSAIRWPGPPTRSPTTRWCRPRRCSACSRSCAAEVDLRHTVHEDRPMKEFPILFGPEDAPLMGMVTTPAEGGTAPVGCLMLNMGAGYRIGPRRINVKLARLLAGQGIPSLRMDLAGLGDSSAPKGPARFTQQAVADLQAAMKLLETTLGIQRFIVIGLCSGG